jgi:hypothetical protein
MADLHFALGSSSWIISLILKMTKLESLFEIKLPNMFSRENSTDDLKQNLFDDRRDDVENSINEIRI